MKRILVVISCILLGILLVYLYIAIDNSVSKKQKEALSNCIEYIHNSSYSADFKKNINTNYVSINNLSDDMKDAVWVTAEGKPNWQKDYWVFTIGDTSGRYYARIVCDKETNSVIGHIPIL